MILRLTISIGKITHNKKKINLKSKIMKTIEAILNEANLNNDLSFFLPIIESKSSGYGHKKPLDNLKSFFEDLQRGGCISGMISDFIYHSDCKDFYIANIDELEDYKREIEDELGEPIKNRHNLPHYTFIVWLCFEEFCYSLYSQIFEQ